MRHRLLFQQWIPYPAAQVFAFFADPHNLPPLMPPWQRARIESASLVLPPAGVVDSSSTPVAGKNSRIMISFRPVPLLPLRMHWDARISHFEWQDHFCDEQLTGPFASWVHCHRVRAEVRDGITGTQIIDDVAYTMKFGLFGELAHVLGGARQMRSLFEYRQHKLKELLAAQVHQSDPSSASG